MNNTMEKQTPKTQDEARQYAIEWQQWQVGESLSYGELYTWQIHFKTLGIKFDLTEEFKENGIC